ncbi:MAG: hypothetical protein AAF550_01735, partial [Myxococcota bacterium]
MTGRAARAPSVLRCSLVCLLLLALRRAARLPRAAAFAPPAATVGPFGIGARGLKPSVSSARSVGTPLALTGPRGVANHDVGAEYKSAADPAPYSSQLATRDPLYERLIAALREDSNRYFRGFGQEPRWVKERVAELTRLWLGTHGASPHPEMRPLHRLLEDLQRFNPREGSILSSTLHTLQLSIARGSLPEYRLYVMGLFVVVDGAFDHLAWFAEQRDQQGTRQQGIRAMTSALNRLRTKAGVRSMQREVLNSGSGITPARLAQIEARALEVLHQLHQLSGMAFREVERSPREPAEADRMRQQFAKALHLLIESTPTQGRADHIRAFQKLFSVAIRSEASPRFFSIIEEERQNTPAKLRYAIPFFYLLVPSFRCVLHRSGRLEGVDRMESDISSFIKRLAGMDRDGIELCRDLVKLLVEILVGSPSLEFSIARCATILGVMARESAREPARLRRMLTGLTVVLGQFRTPMQYGSEALLWEYLHGLSPEKLEEAGQLDRLLGLPSASDMDRQRFSAKLQNRFRRPSLPLRYYFQLLKLEESKLCSGDWPNLRWFREWLRHVLTDDVDAVRRHSPINQKHLSHFSEDLVDRWFGSNCSTADPDTMLMLGEDVGSCQAIT